MSLDQLAHLPRARRAEFTESWWRKYEAEEMWIHPDLCKLCWPCRQTWTSASQHRLNWGNWQHTVTVSNHKWTISLVFAMYSSGSYKTLNEFQHLTTAKLRRDQSHDFMKLFKKELNALYTLLQRVIASPVLVWLGLQRCYEDTDDWDLSIGCLPLQNPPNEKDKPIGYCICVQTQEESALDTTH